MKQENFRKGKICFSFIGGLKFNFTRFWKVCWFWTIPVIFTDQLLERSSLILRNHNNVLVYEIATCFLILPHNLRHTLNLHGHHADHSTYTENGRPSVSLHPHRFFLHCSLCWPLLAGLTWSSPFSSVKHCNKVRLQSAPAFILAKQVTESTTPFHTIKSFNVRRVTISYA